jgi:NAD(P)H-hydrate repair Nnr-like enzyme with NAD(P)H-hydrate epimerase domain
MCYAGIAARCLAFSFDDVRLSVDALCGTGFWGLLPRPSRSLYFH